MNRIILGLCVLNEMTVVTFGVSADIELNGFVDRVELIGNTFAPEAGEVPGEFLPILTGKGAPYPVRPRAPWALTT